jgi:hypothetical protein
MFCGRMWRKRYRIGEALGVGWESLWFASEGEAIMPIQFIAIGARVCSQIAGFERQARRLGPAMMEAVRASARAVFDPYRPELHYMRGPGPKWRAAHVRVRRSD